MEVLSPQNQSSEDWQSLDESWDSRLPTPLALDFSSLREDDDVMPNGGGGDYYVNSDGYRDLPATPDSQHSLRTSNGFIEGDTEYLQMARKGGGHSDLLTVEPHTPTSSPVKCEKKDGQWYSHNGVDITDTQQRKEMMTVSSRPQSSLDSSIDIETDTEYLKIAKKGGGHKDLLTVDPHTPTPEPVKYDKTDGQWYTHDGVDITESQQRKDLSLALNGLEINGDDLSAAGGKETGYLDLAKKGGGHKDLLSIEDHTPSPEPQKYEKKGGDWYNQDDMVIKDGPQETGVVQKRRRTYSDSECKAETEYLRTARKGGGHKDLLTIDPHATTSEPVKYEKRDGQWYTHDGVDVKETQERKEMVTLPSSPRPSSVASSIDIETNTDYLKIAKKGGGHKDLLTIDPHTPTPEPVRYDKTDGQWYTHDGVDVRDTQQRKDLSASINSPENNADEIIAAGENSGDYLKLAKKGGGHKDLLIVDPHTPTSEPVKYDKTDGQWYTHHGVDVKDTQQRKEMVTVASSPRPENLDSSMEVETETNYLKIAKKGGGHKDLLTVEPHAPTPEPVKYDKTDGQWYGHDGVDVKATQQRKELAVSLEAQHDTESLTPAGGNNRDYLDLAKKGGGHKDLLTIDPHAPTPEPVRYDKTDGQWYTHDGVDVKESQQRRESTVSVDDQKNSESVVAAGSSNNSEYLELAKKGGGHQDLLTIEPHTPTPEPVRYDKSDGQWYTHDGVDVRESQQRRDLSMTLESIPEDVAAAGEINGEYLETARKGGRKDLLTIDPHTPTPEPVNYDKKDGQWYTHDGVDVRGTQQRKEMVTVASSPRSPNLDSSMEVETETHYLKIAKKGGGHKDLLTVEPHTPTPEPVQYNKGDGQWYTHDGVDVKDTQQRKEMVTVAASPRPSSAASSVDIETETEYLKIAKKGGGHKDLLTLEPHTPRSEPVKYDKTDGQWYTHDGVDVKDTQQRKEMVTVSNSPRPSNLDSSLNMEADTEYLKIAKKGGGRKDLLTMEPHTPSPEPQRYQKSGGNWYNQNGTETRSPASPSPRKNNNSDTDYLMLARKGGGHSDLLTVEPHTPTPEPVRYDKTDGQWYTHDGVDIKETQQRKDTPSTRRSPCKNPSGSKIPVDINTNTEYLKIARKGGGHKDLLTHTPSPEPQRYQKKGGEVNNNVDIVDGNKTRERKAPRQQNGGSSVQVNTETEYLKTARKGGGHKDLLTIEHHKPSPRPKKQETKLGDWYYQDGSVVKDTLQRKESPSSSPRKTNADSSPANTEYLKMARKGGGHRDLLMTTPQKASPSPSPKPKEMKRNTDSTPVSSPRSASSTPRDSSDYLRLARKGGGHPDLLSSAPRHTSSPGANSFDAMDSPRRKEPSSDGPLRRSASMRHRGTASDYLNIARKGGHHKDLLTMPETSNFQRDQASRRSLRSFRSPVISQVDGPTRPRTAEPRQSHPIWLGGSGPERVHSPGKRFINPSSRFAPFAYHEGSPGAAKNPDKI